MDQELIKKNPIFNLFAGQKGHMSPYAEPLHMIPSCSNIAAQYHKLHAAHNKKKHGKITLVIKMPMRDEGGNGDTPTTPDVSQFDILWDGRLFTPGGNKDTGDTCR